MVGKMILPSLGGAASVWTTCVLFFQGMLLAGYLYAYFLGKLASPRGQFVIHMMLLASAFLTLPIRFGEQAPVGGNSPVAWELVQLMRSVALPFFVVSTTAPLLQSWFSWTKDPAARDPYFLYAASNVGSLSALLLYPFVVDPSLGVSRQSQVWLFGYVLLVILVLIAISEFWKLKTHEQDVEQTAAPSHATRFSWLAAAFVPSALMLAVTNHLSTNLAVVPFLWTLPLATYLLTFILAFGRRLRISAEHISLVAPALLLVLIPILTVGPVRNPVFYLGLLTAHLILLFVGGLLGHTMLARRRPAASHLAEYYVWIAVGGLLGGAFTAVIAPNVFSTVLEYPLLVATLAFFRCGQDTRRRLWDLWFVGLLVVLAMAGWGLSKWYGVALQKNVILNVLGYMTFALAVFAFYRRRWLFAGSLAVAVVGFLILEPLFEDDDRLYVARNFFGVKEVVLERDFNQRKLLHGDTLHGLEILTPAMAGVPISYYTLTGPLGNVMTMMADRPNQRIGVVGLGSGTLAANTQPNRQITLFEIDPQMEGIARGYFSFLPRCGDRCDIVLGDGRLSILQMPDQTFDLLILDAFNSDAIPAHLLSREAVAIYRRKLKPDGAILFHVSNRYLRVRDLVTSLTFDAQLPALYRNDEDINEPGKTRSIYVIAALNTETLQTLDRNQWLQVPYYENVALWTDDYSNLWSLLRWR
jgi:SAM-dependent methyltransferase